MIRIFRCNYNSNHSFQKTLFLRLSKSSFDNYLPIMVCRVSGHKQLRLGKQYAFLRNYSSIFMLMTCKSSINCKLHNQKKCMHQFTISLIPP